MNNTKPQNEAPNTMLYRAAEIKTQIKQLQDEYDMMQPEIVRQVKELSVGTDKYALKVGDIGTFIIAKKRSWTYSQAVQALELKLKEQKKTEEADGTAELAESEILKFNLPKENGKN